MAFVFVRILKKFVKMFCLSYLTSFVYCFSSYQVFGASVAWDANI